MALSPLVTVVTPSFNQARFIGETIQSVLDQDYPAIEYIIIDGGSTDGSVDVIRKYADRLAYWVSETDNGQADAINKGWRMCHGEILAYLNSDDTYTLGAVRRAVEYLVAHPEAAAVSGGYNLINENSQVIQVVPATEFNLESELRGNSICQPTVFMRREPLFEVGLLDARLHYVMDYDLWLKLGIAHRIAHIEAIQANFRIGETSKSLSRIDRFLPEVLQVFDCFFARSDLPPDIRAKRTLAYSDYYAHEAPHPLYRPRNLMSADQVRRMRHALWVSIQWHPLRLKTLWTLAQIFDSYFNTHLAQSMTQIWRQVQSTRT